MKALILTFLIWIIPLAFAQESSWKKSRAKTIWSSVFKSMTYRQPVVFTPFEVKAGYLNYGGDNYWSQFPYNSTSLTITDQAILLDSTQYQFNIIDNVANRQGMFLEIDFLRTNIPHFIVHQNYIDFQLGLGLQLINFFSDPALPSDLGEEWIEDSGTTGNYYFNPRAVGININTSLGWQLSRSRISYIYHSLGISSVSLYESEGGDRTLTGFALNESFGMGAKYIFNQGNTDYNYTVGIEMKWNRLYMTTVDAPDGLSPIHGVDLRASGIFLTSGIQFGGKHTDGDIAYSQMMHNDFISASESYKTFLDQELRHIKRKKAIEMLQYCQSLIPFQKIELGIDAYLRSEFDESLEYFYSARTDVDETLKGEIEDHLQNIALELLDSVENYKNEMSIVNAKKLAQLAGELYPKSKRYSQVMAYLYMDKAKLNTEIGNYSAAIDNYQKALQFYPEIEYIITEKLHGIANSLIKVAYFSYLENEMHMVLKSMRDCTQIQPQMDKELGPYILKLEARIEEIHSEKVNKHAQQYIIDKKQEFLYLTETPLQLGMTYKEAKSIQGTPQFIDKHTEQEQLFEMWTYPPGKDISHLYFRDNMLIQIDK